MELDVITLSSMLKLNVVFLYESIENKLCNFIKNKLNVQNSLTFYLLTKYFKLSSLIKTTFSYIERSFTMIVETKSFLELDVINIFKIFRSSNLLITSELEVFDSADKWLSYNIKERSKFAKDLLLTIRFPLLSECTLKYLLEKSSSFIDIKGCYKLLQEISERKGIVFQNKSSNYYKSRFCSQDMFDIYVCGGFDKNAKAVGKVRQIHVNTFKNIEYFPSMMKDRTGSQAVCVNGEVYVFAGWNDSFKCINSVEKYSRSTKTWNIISSTYDKRQNFCACSFMSTVFVIGGNTDNTATNSCLRFDTKDCSWKEVAGMNEARTYAACAVFEERIVVCGGFGNRLRNNLRDFNSVESYDVTADAWTPMPNMIEPRMGHSLVAVVDKLFVLGGYKTDGACEVFERISNKFVNLKSVISFSSDQAFAIGTKIYILQGKKSFIVTYDFDKDEWSKEPSDATENIDAFSCAKLPVY